MNDTNIQVGAYGWLHPYWETTFYPDDMPSEWCLSYYSNEFNTVMVPASYWQKDKGYDCENWIDDIHDEFRFYVECPVRVFSEETEVTLFLRELECLQPYLAGVFLPKQLVTQGNVTQLRRIAQLTNLFSCVDGVECEIKPVWYADATDNESSAQLAIFEDNLTQLRRTRVNVETFVEKNPVGRQQDIIVKHETLAVSDLMKFRSVVEIMGL